MLTFEQKQAIIETFPELTRKEISLKRVNYHYEESTYDKTVVVQNLHPNGNAFVYVAGTPGYDVDDRGLFNVREATEEELRKAITDSIKLLSEEDFEEQAVEQKWVNGEGIELKLVEEEDIWNVYHALNLEESFSDYAEAVKYLKEEQFSLIEEGV